MERHETTQQLHWVASSAQAQDCGDHLCAMTVQYSNHPQCSTHTQVSTTPLKYSIYTSGSTVLLFALACAAARQ